LAYLGVGSMGRLSGAPGRILAGRLLGRKELRGLTASEGLIGTGPAVRFASYTTRRRPHSGTERRDATRQEARMVRGRSVGVRDRSDLNLAGGAQAVVCAVRELPLT